MHDQAKGLPCVMCVARRRRVLPRGLAGAQARPRVCTRTAVCADLHAIPLTRIPNIHNRTNAGLFYSCGYQVYTIEQMRAMEVGDPERGGSTGASPRHPGLGISVRGAMAFFMCASRFAVMLITGQNKHRPP